MLDAQFWTPLNIKDIAYLGSLVIGVIAFYQRTNETLKRLTKLCEYSHQFTINSDKYHSQVTGQDFQQGRPVNGEPGIKHIRDIIIGQEQAKQGAA